LNTSDMPFALRPGTMITGYEITRVIGAGGFGITYEGYNPITERRVAIKEFFPRGIASREDATRIAFSKNDDEIVGWALKRFAESTTRLAKLKHPNIIEVLNYVADNGTGYMVMELVEGHTLEEWLRAKPSAPALSELGPIFDPIFDALEYVHKNGLIHRDIAPDNIMIRGDGRPVLIDFGALKQIADQALAHGPVPKSFGVSKANYSPPEQSDDSSSVDPRMDVYSLAATIYRALAGKPPIDADKRKTDTALKGQDSYVPLAQASSASLPAEFTSAIDSALSLRPRERPASVAEFRAKLAARTSEPVSEQANEPATRVIKPQARADVTPMHAYSGPTPPPYQPQAGSADSGQSYTPAGSAQPMKRSGVSIANIAAVVLILVGSGAVLLHRPIANFLDRTMGTKFMTDNRDQPQQKQVQKQPPPQQQQNQPQKQLPPTQDVGDAIKRGNDLLRQGNYRQAVDAYNEAVRANPRNSIALVGRGIAYENLGQADNAIKDFDEALRNDRTSVSALLGRGRIYLTRRDFVTAYSDFSDAARLNANNGAARQGRGLANEGLGRRDEAIREFREALRLDSNLTRSREALQRLGG
jgi:serine/threonine protein kinase